MRLLEDMLSVGDVKSIDAVIASENPRFDHLVSVSGLDRAKDFRFADLRNLNLCGADLRGFDFTGSDLRNCARNDNTIIDETTILAQAQVDWVELEALPIVTRMQEVESSLSPEKRRQKLKELIEEFGTTPHVVKYITSAATRARSLDDFLDFIMFLPRNVSNDLSLQLGVAGEKLLAKKLGKAKNRTRRDKTSIFAVEEIVAKLQKTSGSFSERIFGILVEIVNEKNLDFDFRGAVAVEPKDIEKAFSRLVR